jgi:hypothetical protein
VSDLLPSVRRMTTCDCRVHRPEPTTDPSELRTTELVSTHGWQVMVVGSGACDCGGPRCSAGSSDDGPSWAYTIGLPHVLGGGPELVVSGLDPALMGAMLNGLADRAVVGLDLHPGLVLEGVLGGVPVVLEEVAGPALGELVCWSSWFHRRPVPALAVVWPDTAARFPWQPGASAPLPEAQPVGWRVPFPHSGPLAADPDWVFPLAADEFVVACRCITELGAPVAAVTNGEAGWTFCCIEGHRGGGIEDWGLVHAAHVVRAAPSVRDLADLPPGWQGLRARVDAPWQRRPVARVSAAAGGR